MQVSLCRLFEHASDCASGGALDHWKYHDCFYFDKDQVQYVPKPVRPPTLIDSFSDLNAKTH